MNMQEIRGLAKDYGIKAERASKVELIRSIQVAEGNFNCFASALDGDCDQMNCKWREDCFTAAKKLHS